MKTFITKMATAVASLALVVTAASVNSLCFCWMHQPELPERTEMLLRN